MFVAEDQRRWFGEIQLLERNRPFIEVAPINPKAPLAQRAQSLRGIWAAVDIEPAMAALGNVVDDPKGRGVALDHVHVLDPHRFAGPKYRTDVPRVVHLLEDHGDATQAGGEHGLEAVDPLVAEERTKKIGVARPCGITHGLRP